MPQPVSLVEKVAKLFIEPNVRVPPASQQSTRNAEDWSWLQDNDGHCSLAETERPSLEQLAKEHPEAARMMKNSPVAMMKRALSEDPLNSGITLTIRPRDFTEMPGRGVRTSYKSLGDKLYQAKFVPADDGSLDGQAHRSERLGEL